MRTRERMTSPAPACQRRAWVLEVSDSLCPVTEEGILRLHGRAQGTNDGAPHSPCHGSGTGAFPIVFACARFASDLLSTDTPVTQ